MDAQLPREGWYPDPAGGTRLRWWDGTDWADRYRTRPLDRAALVSDDQARLIEQRVRAAAAKEVKANPLEHAPELRAGAGGAGPTGAGNPGAGNPGAGNPGAVGPNGGGPTRTPPPPGAVRMPAQPGRPPQNRPQSYPGRPSPAQRNPAQQYRQAAPGQAYPGRPAPGPGQAVPPTPAPPQRPGQPTFGRVQSYQKPLRPSPMQVGGSSPRSSLNFSRGMLRFLVVLGIVLAIRLLS